MAISGIGSYSSNYGYYQAVSQMRLTQALSKNPKIQQSLKAVESVSSVSSYYQNGGLDFLKSYSSTMTDVMDSANALRGTNTKSAVNTLTATSSDTSVAEVSTKYASRIQTQMTVDVQSLAQAQVNVSSGVKGSEQASADMDFEVAGKSGSVAVKVSAQNDDGSLKTNREMLKEAAKQINAGDAGVKATVEEKDGVATLKLSGQSTGTGNTFRVSGDMGAAAGAQDVQTAASNAQYSVTTNLSSGGKVTLNYTSESNDVTLDDGRISATLKGVGETTVGRQMDSGKVVDAMSDLVDSYNSAVKFLQDNVSHGSGVSSQLSKLQSSLGSSSTLNRLGLSVQADGTLSLDKEKLTESLTESPDLTKDLVSGTSGIAQKLYSKATSALQTNSQSLVNYDLQEYEQSSVYDPLQFMGVYSKVGATQMNNYLNIGLLMNYLV